MLSRYFKRVGGKRIFVMLLGNVFLGMGVSIFKIAELGNDAYNGMLMALAERVGIAYGHFFVLFSVGLFLIELLAGRGFVGLGTVVNTFLLGYIVTAFLKLWAVLFPMSFPPAGKVAVMLIGVLVASLGISLYQTPDVGVSPYDSLSLIAAQRLPKIPYFWCRMFTDGLCALICFLAGGLVGLGTLVAAFGFGPFIHFFDVHITNKILAKKTKANIEIG